MSPSPTPVAFHDFGAIEGEWEGIHREGATGALEGRTVAVIHAGAETGRPVADVAHYFPVHAPEPWCEGNWIVRGADHPEYQVDERMDECAPGSVVLTYDADTDALAYRFEPLHGRPSGQARGEFSRVSQ